MFPLKKFYHNRTYMKPYSKSWRIFCKIYTYRLQNIDWLKFFFYNIYRKLMWNLFIFAIHDFFVERNPNIQCVSLIWLQSNMMVADWLNKSDNLLRTLSVWFSKNSLYQVDIISNNVKSKTEWAHPTLTKFCNLLYGIFKFVKHTLV